MVNKKTFLAFLLVFVLAVQASSQLEANKYVRPTKTTAAGMVEFTISVSNIGGEMKTVTVKEFFSAFTPLDFQPTMTDVPAGIVAATMPYHEWTLAVGAGETESVSYKAAPNTPGLLSSGPAEARSTDGDYATTNSVTVSVECKADAYCDESAGENFLSCPEDCLSKDEAPPQLVPNLAAEGEANAMPETGEAKTDGEKASAVVEGGKLFDNPFVLIIGLGVAAVLLVAGFSRMLLNRKP